MDKQGWKKADTSVYLLLRILFSDVKNYGINCGVAIGNALGKTFSALDYAKTQENVFVVSCMPGHSRKTFIVDLLWGMGLNPSGSVADMIGIFASHVNSLKEPLFIIDDAHILKPEVLTFMITLANVVSGKAGMIIMGNEKLRQDIADGVRLNKTGYSEIYSNIGRRFITLSSLGFKDVELVCRANGICDEETLREISQRGNLRNIQEEKIFDRGAIIQ